MTAAPNPAPLTLEDWFALGEDESLRRAELCRGVLEVSPSPRLKHTRAIRRLANAIEAQLPGDFEVYDETDVIVHHRPATAEVLKLVDGRYEGPTVTDRIRTKVPVALDIDLTALDHP